MGFPLRFDLLFLNHETAQIHKASFGSVAVGADSTAGYDGGNSVAVGFRASATVSSISLGAS